MIGKYQKIIIAWRIPNRYAHDPTDNIQFDYTAYECRTRARLNTVWPVGLVVREFDIISWSTIAWAMRAKDSIGQIQDDLAKVQLQEEINKYRIEQGLEPE